MLWVSSPENTRDSDTHVLELPNKQPVIPIMTDKAEGCYYTVGKTPSGKLILCLNVGIIQHEFLHALGFTHEQNRPDRDAYASINWSNNIVPKHEHNFQTDPTSETLDSSYANGSVLHYSTHAFAIDNVIETITTHDSSVTVGLRDGASEQDSIKVRLLYQCILGPRTLLDYEAELCTLDRKCWEGAFGCNGNDEACQGTLIFSNKECFGEVAVVEEQLKNMTMLYYYL
jgi:hypothetical protein